MNNYSEIPTGLTDCISRQAVIDSLYDWSNHSMTDAETWHLRQVIGDIKSMPSVTPQEPKQGRWDKDGACPFCGYLQQWDDDNYCGHCGAKLNKINQDIKQDEVEQ